VAILLVVAYHVFPRQLPGAFIGVDVFFVVSGYLITRLILIGLQDRTFSLAGFYQRRVRRIVPALLLLLAVCFAFGWYALLPGEFSWLGRSMAWCAGFLANGFFARNTRYFEPWADHNPLLHLWSLGVEEQFYLVWPLLLLLAKRYDVTRPVLRAVIGASLAISIWGMRHAPASHFYMPAARAWELAVGGLIAARQLDTACTAIAGESRALARRFGRHGGSVAGLALIAAGAALLSGSDGLPGIWGAVPVGGAALLITAGPGSLVNRQLLVRAPMVFVGKLSYSLYLWHWPVLTFGRIVLGSRPPPALSAMLLAVAAIAAYAGYRWVEMPLRYETRPQTTVALSLATLAALTLLGAGTAAGLVPGRLSGPAFAAWDAAAGDWVLAGETRTDPRSGIRMLAVQGHRANTALFVGDSHMQQYWPRVISVVESHPDAARSALLITLDGCLPLPGVNSLEQARECPRLIELVTRQAYQPDVDTIVFGAFWELYLLGEYSIPWTLGVYGTDDDLFRARLRLDSPGTQLALQRFERLLARLHASGRRVFIVLSSVTSPAFVPTVPPRVRLSLRHSPMPGVDGGGSRLVPAAPFEAFVAPLMSRLREIAARSGARVLDPRTTLCAASLCPAVGPDGLPLYIDSNHLRSTAARERAAFLDVALLEPQSRSGIAPSIKPATDPSSDGSDPAGG
jgi:peptidoglycan/LPS O-acetylase OafA/YrhL